ncbi:MAG: fumarylacetoacetate hydrolase family protein [Candidatus Kapabacteria bacterium]|nr:fumarylacetoacetate hydrolase family protein [Ignavibacteriota bacterium]MCW5883345.1 fumarylacetoacetate hydrolase family protein [Candidatus Kapabacteria bacterium]
MKLVTYQKKDLSHSLGIMLDGSVFDLQKSAFAIGHKLPTEMLEFLKGGEEFMEIAREVEKKIIKSGNVTPEKYLKLASPVLNPPSMRDGYAFRQHVAAARRNRGVDMIPEFDSYPIFYFTNHNAVFGEGDVIVENDHLHKLDFELEWAVIIGKSGKNISSQDADSHIAGFTIMNDLSARRLQMEEMLLNLGPAKGKDFATTLGPFMITPDELEDRKIETPFGNLYDLEMTAYHNGKQVSLGNTKDMTWTFAEIIERASYGVELHIGDVIGSGTVGTGCYLELNGTWAREAKERGEDFTPVWLNNGDEIELRVERLGSLKNRMVLSANNVSILDKKKAF